MSAKSMKLSNLLPLLFAFVVMGFMNIVCVLTGFACKNIKEWATNRNNNVWIPFCNDEWEELDRLIEVA